MENIIKQYIEYIMASDEAVACYDCRHAEGLDCGCGAVPRFVKAYDALVASSEGEELRSRMVDALRTLQEGQYDKAVCLMVSCFFTHISPDDNWVDLLDEFLFAMEIPIADNQDGLDPSYEIVRLADGRICYLSDPSASGWRKYAIA